MTTLACLGFVGHATIVNPSATATFCTPSTVYVITPPPIPPPFRAALPQSFWPVEESNA